MSNICGGIIVSLQMNYEIFKTAYSYVINESDFGLCDFVLFLSKNTNGLFCGVSASEKP